MEQIKKDLQELIMQCDCEDIHSIEDSLDKIDEILNIIDGVTDVDCLADCKIAIMRMQQILREDKENEYYESYVQEYTSD